MFLKIVCRAFGDSGFEFFLFKQKTAYEMRISDWSSDVCSSDLWFRAGLPEWPTIFGQIPRAMICGDLVGGSAGAINVDQFVDQRDAWLEFFKGTFSDFQVEGAKSYLMPWAQYGLAKIGRAHV